MNAMPKNSRLAVSILALAVAVGSSGCGAKDFKPSKMFSLDSAWPFEGDDEPEEGVPVRLVGAWTDTVLTKPAQNPQRGFGGRIMFYGEDGEEPILVDGQLVVYAFDETGREPTNNKPTRRYVFPPEQMKLHMSKSDVGASYSFWLPWDEVGGPKTEVSLICRFEPKGGSIVTGEQTRHLLPGKMAGEMTAANYTPPQVPEGVPMRPAQPTLEDLQSKNQQAYSSTHQASYETGAAQQPAALSPNVADAASPMAGRQMTVTSINLPQSFQMPDPSSVTPTATQPGTATHPQAQPMRPVQPAVYQPPAAAQPMNTVQPMSAVQPTSAAMPMNVGMRQGGMTGAVAMPQTPNMLNPSVANTATTIAPNQGFSAPINIAPFVGQQTASMPGTQSRLQPSSTLVPPGASMTPPGINVMAPGTQLNPSAMQAQTNLLHQHPQTVQQQPAMNAGLSQQLPTQQAWQQMPTSNMPRTAGSSPATAQIPWR
jgi:hypothetical protein